MTPPRISAFPKCWLDDICSGRMLLLDWIETSRVLGATGLEMYVPFFRRYDDAELAEVRAAVERSGRECSLLCFSPDFTHPDRALREQELERQLRAIDAAALLGAECCRTLSGQRRPDVRLEDGIAWTVECVRRAADHAERRGVRLAMENHYKDGFWRWPELAQRADVFVEIVDQIESPAFGVQFDPSNAVMAGDDPVELLRRVRHRVVSVHASDRHPEPGATLDELRAADGSIGYPERLRHGVTGEGLNDWDAIFACLRESGFAGWISIEDGMNGLEEMARSVDFLRAKVAEHWPATDGC